MIEDEPCLPTETETKLMDDILVLFIKNKLTYISHTPCSNGWAGS